MLSCPTFSNHHVIVIGDAMLDRYWHGDTSRISPEAPVPVVKIEQNEERVGGAANVAVNVQALGLSTTLISVIGDDDSGVRLSQMLEQQGVHFEAIRLSSLKTTLKLRVLGRHQQLLRLDFEDKRRWPAQMILEPLKKVIAKANIVILSDYAKGVLAEPQAIIEYARSCGAKVLVDPKNADLSVYRGANILTPNLAEFEAAVGPCKNVQVIESKAQALIQQLDLEAILVTRGSQGMSLISSCAPPLHIKANAREVFDITGAGDTVIAVLSACLAAKTPLAEAAQLANIAAGIAVGKLGTAMITREELDNALQVNAPLFPSKIHSLATLMLEVLRYKAKGKRIVVTNGCFDILHAGHVAYLQQARALGDCLIVAVNDDLSVQRLKGSSRPINRLDERMAVLSALGCVDFVIPFSEETPEKLIETILPHILVKGGDYEPHQIAGAKAVLQNGGRVEILPFVSGCSTTSILERLENSEGELV